jgi:hypothetical protein
MSSCARRGNYAHELNNLVKSVPFPGADVIVRKAWQFIARPLVVDESALGFTGPS